MVMGAVHGGSKHSNHHGALLATSISNGSMQVLYENQVALVVNANVATVKADLHLPTGLQDLSLTLGGDLQSFLLSMNLSLPTAA